MKRLIPPLFVALVIATGWGEEWIYASRLSMSECNALASEIHGELEAGTRADCRQELGAGSMSFPDINAISNARSTFARTRRANELQQGALEEQRQRNELLRLQTEALK